MKHIANSVMARICQKLSAYLTSFIILYLIVLLLLCVQYIFGSETNMKWGPTLCNSNHTW